MPNINKVVFGNTTLIDLTDSTLSDPSQLASGVTAYDRAGTKITGTGGGSVVVTDEPNTTGTTAVVTADDVTTLITKSITQNGTYTASSDGADGYSSVTVNVSGGGSATQHTIHLEFSDSTDTDISVYYNDSLLGTMITNYEPSTWTYNNKTVYIAELDGVEWYDATPSPATWETLINANIHVNAGNPYGGIWISDLGSVSIALDSVWRVTFDNGEPYILTATANGIYGSPNQNIIGNPLFMGGQDDGSDVPFCFEQNPWGAWTGGTDTSITQEVDHIIKIERQVSA